MNTPIIRPGDQTPSAKDHKFFISVQRSGVLIYESDGSTWGYGDICGTVAEGLKIVARELKQKHQQ